jgi:Protein of unknown function (DUF2934)
VHRDGASAAQLFLDDRRKLSRRVCYWRPSPSGEGKPTAKPTEDQIRQRAQELWEENHRPTGRDDEFWYQAERELSQGVNSDEKSETFLE